MNNETSVYAQTQVLLKQTQCDIFGCKQYAFNIFYVLNIWLFTENCQYIKLFYSSSDEHIVYCGGNVYKS